MKALTISELFNFSYDEQAFYVLYHGTKGDVNEVVDNPMMKQSANGYGLYLTTSLAVALAYGKAIAYLVPRTFEVDTMRPMENMDAIEYVISTQKTYVEFLKTMEDATIV